MAVSTPELVRELEELIAAIDRRLPHIAVAGEADIAREAAALRARAVARIAEITARESASAPKQAARP